MAYNRTKLNLSNEQVMELEEFIRNAPSKRIGVRASMVLDCGTGMTGKDVAAKYSERPGTVSFWKKRYAASGVSGLLNQPFKAPLRRATPCGISTFSLSTWAYRSTA